MQAVLKRSAPDPGVQEARRNLLIISYLFPPAGGIGVQRALSFAKYLPQYGFNVHVLQARNAAAPVSDPALLQQIPPQTQLHSALSLELPFALRQSIWRWLGGSKKSSSAASKSKTTSFHWKQLPTELVRRILCPEPEVLWVPLALRAARRIIREHQIQDLLVTVPPFSVLLVASSLKREFPHLNLIADFRDDWLRFYLSEFEYQKSTYVTKRAAAIEREAVQLSNRVVVVTGFMLSDIRARYPDQDSQKFALIPNGYDPGSFPSVKASKHLGNQIVVSHIGTVYSASSPRFYLDAVDGLPPDIRERVETRFVGRFADSEKAYLQGRKSSILTLGFRPQSEALTHMAEADYLLLTMTDAASLTGKLFEYLAVGKPIIAVARKDGEVARVLQETGSGWCAAPDDPAGLRQLLLHIFENHDSGHPAIQPNREAIREYERPRLAGQLGSLIRNLDS
jgi:glycosyltransferase involved in cell wall biosynthesis